MNDQYVAFFRVLGAVSRASFDSSPTFEPEEDLHRPLGISADTFLNELYERRAAEKVIREKLVSSHEVVCLVGPRGCGKSSLGLRIKHDLSPKSYFVTFVDIRMERFLDALRTGDAKDLHQYLRRRISAEYDRRLFPYEAEGTVNPRLQLYEYLLQSGSEDSKPLTLFFGIQDLETRAARYYARWKSFPGANRHSDTYYDWLSETHNDEAKVEDLITELEERIEPTHLAFAARFVCKVARQIIWLDNIDAIDDDLQVEAIDTLKDFLRTASNYASCVIAVREENVFKEFDPDEGGPPYDTRVMMEVTRSQSGGTVYPAIDIPLVADKTLANILSKRLRYARDQQVAEVGRLTARKERLNKQLKAESKDTAHTSLYDGLNATEEELSLIKPVISKERFEFLKALSDKAVGLIKDEKVILLANNTLRDLLQFHRDFLRHLIAGSGPNIEPPVALKYERWYLATLFFAWIRHTQRRHQVGMYDVIADCERWHGSPHGLIGCLLPHQVLTTIWNLSLKRKVDTGKRLNNITVGETIRQLKLLGYGDRNDIVECLYFLCHQPGSRGNFLELKQGSSPRDVKSHEDVRDEHFARITFRGKVMASFVASSFGYLHECRRFHEHPEEDPFAHPSIKNTGSHMRGLMPYVCDLAHMHLTEFRRIRSSGALGVKQEALDNYLIQFGIPQEPPYDRKHSIGREYFGVRRALQLESILSSLIGYLPPDKIDIAKQLNHLRDIFMTAIRDIKSEDDIKFRQELGFPERSVNAGTDGGG
ncbi:MAG: hypothetical protein GY847_23540 [Proteobacteria bacterium]|nr:hypothetical protein [Pseudomonadota bacterium]